MPGMQLIPDMQWHSKKEIQSLNYMCDLCAGPGPLSEIEGVMKQEYALAVRMCGRGDFAEGNFHTQNGFCSRTRLTCAIIWHSALTSRPIKLTQTVKWR